MSTGLIIASASLLALTVTALALRHGRETAALKKLAAANGWTFSARSSIRWMARLCDVSLLSLGHTRRIATALRAGRDCWLIPYVFETGLEHRVTSHSWRLVVCEVEHGCSRATITRQDWLFAAASTCTSREFSLSAEDRGDASGELLGIVEDPEEWDRRLDSGLRGWFAAQPAGRSWEILPGLIVGHEPGDFTPEKLRDILKDATALKDYLASPAGDATGAESSAKATGSPAARAG